ncbi:hypothetical protein [Arsenicicoccus bolidensis]|uniref:hypothetical protein n=1 Tax=Arsenicicoccus bolidensis TaxID=229480 RepID=UPI00041B1661|nr:hypothetical protein [Arsenicicoccus bolidensis]
MSKAPKSTTSARTLLMPPWCVVLLRERRRRLTGDGPVFPDARGGWRARNNVE